jgi:mannose-1-phosphate guanylyltransferase/mannose-1-phosphate guanylyltransferase/mannose-6-phosphate isomerase
MGSFFSMALERALGAIDTRGDGRVIIIAGKAHRDLILEACGKYGETERKHMVFIPEPEAKNTAPAIACGLVYA